MSDDGVNKSFRYDENGNIIRAKKHLGLRRCSRRECFNFDDQENPVFKRCAKCKTQYCSRECQKLDWPAHKPNCTSAPPDANAYNKVLVQFCTTPYLRLFLVDLAIYKFGLHLKDKETLVSMSSKPLEMDVYIQYEPANIKDFLDLFNAVALLNTLTSKKPIPGIPQISLVQCNNGETPPKKEALEFWKYCLEEDHKGVPPTEPRLCVAVRFLQFLGNESTLLTGPPGKPFLQSTISCWKIETSAIDAVRAREKIRIPVDIPNYEIAVVPANTETAIELVNAAIRADTRNAMYMRMPIPEFDRHVISLASVPLSQDKLLSPRAASSAMALRVKVNREKIYAISAWHYGYKNRWIPEVSFDDYMSLSDAEKAREEAEAES